MSLRAAARSIAPFLTLVAACGSPQTPGAHPHDMSAAQHESMAGKESATAQTHSAQYNPDAAVQTERCTRGGVANTGVDGACWTTASNPTATHLEEAQKHHKMAADHRAASQALRDAEARVCVGISESDRDMSPFDHREDIASVEPLTVNVSSGKGQYARTEGVVVTLRAVPGMTAQWLQRLVDCHLARNAALGHDVPEMAYCPLVPKGATARVSGTDAGFAVVIRSDDSQTAQEILRRGRALASRP